MQLDITNVGPSDYGAYHCIAKNEMGITKGIFNMLGKSFIGAFFANLWKMAISFIMCVCLLVCPFVCLPTWNNMACNGCTSWDLISEYFFCTTLRKFKFHLNLTKIMATLHEDMCTFMTISRWILPRMRNVSDHFEKNIKTHILCSETFPKNHVIYNIMWIKIW